MSNQDLGDSVDEIFEAFFSTGAHKHKVHTLTFADDEAGFDKRKVFKIVDEVQGVEGVQVDEQNLKVHFVLDGQISPVTEALNKAGYRFKEVH